MTALSSIIAVDTADQYIHVRFRDPDEFDAIRTPDWAQNVSESVSSGSEVRMGRRPDGDEWKIQSVLIEKHVGESKAKEQAARIASKLKS